MKERLIWSSDVREFVVDFTPQWEKVDFLNLSNQLGKTMGQFLYPIVYTYSVIFNKSQQYD